MRRLMLEDGVWRYRIREVRGEWWERPVVVELRTPGGRTVILGNRELGFGDRAGAVTPGLLRRWIEENRP
jgi:hypothetical protein